MRLCISIFYVNSTSKLIINHLFSYNFFYLGRADPTLAQPLMVEFR